MMKTFKTWGGMQKFRKTNPEYSGIFLKIGSDKLYIVTNEPVANIVIGQTLRNVEASVPWHYPTDTVKRINLQQNR